MRGRWLWLGLIVMLALAAPAGAAELTVTSTADDGPNTLRDAIAQANALAGADHVTLPSGTIALATALPAIIGPVTIEGVGPGSVVRAPGTFRVLTVNAGAQQVTLKQLTVTGGREATGGGVLTQSPLTLDTVVVSGNTASAPAGGKGGGVAAQNAGLVTLKDTRVTGNSADDGGSLGASTTAGGGVYATGASQVAITTSTIDANTATATAGAAQGGGLSLGAPAQIATSTITGNSTAGGGLALTAGSVQDSTVTDSIANAGGSVAVRSSVLGGSCTGTFASQGYNVVAGLGCPHGSSDRVVNLDIELRLGGLADNGGPTPTRMPASASPIVDAGNATGPADQRGQPRPYDAPAVPNATGGNGSDAGAVERHDELPPRTIAVTSGADTGPGTLRQAIVDANATTAEDTVEVPAMTITLQSGLPEITDPLVIHGSGAAATVVRADDAISFLRPFVVYSPTTFAALTIANGHVSGRGGGIYADLAGTAVTLDHVVMSGNVVKGTATADGGGAIFSSGPAVTIRSSRLTGNQLRNGGAGIPSGGAVLVSGGATLTVERSTFDANSVGANMNGGAIAVTGGAKMSMSRSTVTGNTATIRAGGIYNGASGSEAKIMHSTIAGNAAPTGANLAVAATQAGSSVNPIEVSGSIVAEARGGGANCVGVASPFPSDLFDGDGCSGNLGIVVADAGLAPLANNGGPTPTRALLGTSPAVDQGYDTEPDQRGLPRPVDHPDRPDRLDGNGADIGAYELQDVTAPDTQIDTKPDPAAASRDATLTFSSPEASATFVCSLDAAAKVACSSPATFHELADGQHTFRVQAVDAAGNEDPTAAAYTWTVDTTGPDTAIDAGPSGVTGASGATLEFSSGEAGVTFQCKLDAQDFAACTSPRQLSGLSEGSHTFSVRALDAVGNPDPTPATRTWTVDLTPASTAIESGPEGTVTGTGATFTFLAGESGATFRCKLDDGAFAACTSPKSYDGLSAGVHTFAVAASDAVGNEDPTPATRTWTVAAAPTPTPTATTTPTATATAEPTATATATAEPTATATATTTAEPTATATVAVTPTAEPTPTATVAPADTTPPTVTVRKRPKRVTKRRRVVVRFRASEPATFTCKVDRRKAKRCRSPLKARVKRGRHTIVIVATDAAGNRSKPAKVRFRVR